MAKTTDIRAAKPKPLSLEQRIDKLVGVSKLLDERLRRQEGLGKVLTQAWDEKIADTERPVPYWVQVFSFVVAAGVVGYAAVSAYYALGVG